MCVYVQLRAACKARSGIMARGKGGLTDGTKPVEEKVTKEEKRRPGGQGRRQVNHRKRHGRGGRAGLYGPVATHL